ncbi:MAG: hypothetical protein R2941_05085 [Desulfobacterales bacterium]
MCLNGDIDNYLKLKEQHEHDGCRIHQDITTDTKMIPLQIEKYLRTGNDVTKPSRLVVNDFEGSMPLPCTRIWLRENFFWHTERQRTGCFHRLAEDHWYLYLKSMVLLKKHPLS